MKSTIAYELTSVISFVRCVFWTERSSLINTSNGRMNFSVSSKTAFYCKSIFGKHILPSFIKNLMKHGNSNFSAKNLCDFCTAGGENALKGLPLTKLYSVCLGVML